MSTTHRWLRRDAGRASRTAFTLVEALVSTVLTVMAGSAVLLALSSSLQTTQTVMEQTIAEGIAQQLLDEVAGRRYAAQGVGPRQWPMGPSRGEGPHRAGYDDLDDFHGYASSPSDPWAMPLGQGDGQGGLRHTAFRLPGASMQNWRSTIEVFYVSDSDLSLRLSAGATSYHRAVQARVYAERSDGSSRLIADVRRVFSYVPAP